MRFLILIEPTATGFSANALTCRVVSRPARRARRRSS